MAGHEMLRSSRRISVSSDRNFGLVFAGLFLAIALWPAIRHGEAVRWWALGVGAIFAGLALFREEALAPLNRLWFRLGLALHAIMSPAIMGLLFFAAVLPVALVLKALGKDILRLRPSEGPTYWILREPPGPPRNSMNQQF